MIRLGNVEVTADMKRPYVIAEIGVHHEGDLDRGKRLIDAAVEGGADSVKFQAYKAETIAVENSPSYWDRTKEPTPTQYALFKKYDTFNYKEYEALARHAEKAGTVFSCTPFDFESADFLFDLMPFYKISSSDLTNTPFLRYIAKKGKPLILSTGASTLAEIDTAVRVIRESGDCQLALLHCVLNYPCKPEAANLETIKLLKNIYGQQYCIGYSDHVPADPALLTLTYAYLNGAVILEKHFTDNKQQKGNDHNHSMDKEDLKTFRKNIDFYHALKGSYQKDYLANEAPARSHARRSVVAARDLKIGERITLDNVTFKRPAHGISPALIDYIIGAEVSCDVKADTQLQFEHLKGLSSPKA